MSSTSTATDNGDNPSIEGYPYPAGRIVTINQNPRFVQRRGCVYNCFFSKKLLIMCPNKTTISGPLGVMRVR